MLQLRDWILLTVTFASMATGILYPRIGEPFSSLPKYFMMALLFLSFVSIKIGHVFHIFRQGPWKMAFVLGTKLLFLPVAVYFVFRAAMPEYALAVLLLSGVSTGVVSPFFSILLGANTPLVLAMVVTTSLLVPFTLPFLVKTLAGSTLEISWWSMTQLLSMVVFIPIVLVETLRRWAPHLLVKLEKGRYPASLALFSMTNLGVFSKYSGYFRAEPMTVLVSFGVVLCLAVIYFSAGLAYSRGRPLEEQMSIVICFAVMNNILVLVFSSEFFGPVETAVAAVYSIPFFGILIPLRLYGMLKRKRN